jgi:two-component system chemotaxis sensor kinase CheA
MAKKDDDFLKKLLATFKVEAEEHLRAMSSRLLELEKTTAAEKRKEMIEAIFREAHSLKGAARSVNVTDIESVCQSMENVLAGLKRGEITPSPESFDLFHQAVGHLDRLLSSLGAERTADERSKMAVLIRQLESLLEGTPRPLSPEKPEKIESQQSVISEKYPLLETVRVAVGKLDSVLLQTEELLSAKLTASQQATDLREIHAAVSARENEWAKVHPALRTIQQSLEKNGGLHEQGKKNPQIVKLLEFLERDNVLLKFLEGKLATLAMSVDHGQRALAGMVDSLLEDMKKTLMLPFSTLLEIFPKLVRDLSRDRGKEAELVIQGAEIEMDRRILEELKDPLIHLVRNCIDHGIEKPLEREGKNKPRCGKITMTISQKDGSKVEVLIADDGAGVDVGKVRSAALKIGVVSQEEAEKLSEVEILPLIFQSGISTSPIITDLSGRGLGLAIVREKVERLGGVVAVETQPDIGATFRMVLPVTLATFRGILIRVNDRFFVIRTTHMQRVGRVRREGIKTVENRETIELNGQAVSLVRLGDLLGLSRKRAESESKESIPFVVLGLAEKRIAFLVDEILGEQEVLVKSLGEPLSRVRNIAGATVLGTGQVVPILNVHDLMKSSVKATAAPVTVPVATEEAEAKRRSVLVVEDSITARTLLKNILESAGYQVKTAVDGVEAITALKTEAFDLVVSDVDMPRMNGFDLTAKIRSDKKFSDLPVVLVTALESREDRERGIDVGANAYIVKSSFDQSNLLGVIRRLV